MYFDLLCGLESHFFPTGSFRGPRRISCTTLQVVYQVMFCYVFKHVQLKRQALQTFKALK